MLLCHFQFSFKEDKLNFRFIGTLKVGVLPIRIVVKSHVSSVGPSPEKNIKTFYDCIGGCKETKRVKTTLYNKKNTKWRFFSFAFVGYLRKDNLYNLHLSLFRKQSFQQLRSVLVGLVKGSATDLAFSSAICLGKHCVVDPIAKNYLMAALETERFSSQEKGEVIIDRRYITD